MSPSSSTPTLPKILVVDDDAGQRSLLDTFLTRLGHRVDCACDGEQALDLLNKGHYDLIFSDVQMPKCDGLTLLSRIVAMGLATPVILITGYADVKQAVQALSAGALTYLEKPIDLDELLALLKKTLTITEPVATELPYLPHAVVEAKVMKDLYQEVSLVAPSMARVLLTGESGCGKEILAEHLHHWSSRTEEPLIKINCAAIPENLLESELFGHEKGAFTGAQSSREGCFERANQGTLFLDEIGEMSLPCQAKLLRVLQDGLITRVGGTQSIQVDVRVISATNRQLEDEIVAGNFREDLFYRLNVIELFIPPLRERRGDILALAKFFCQKFSKEPIRWSKGFEQIFLDYPWPGNVRELQNAVERAVLLGHGSLLIPDHLPKRLLAHQKNVGARTVSSAPSTSTLAQVKTLEEQETINLLMALEQHGGNRSEAAKALGIARRTLLYKIKALEESGVAVPPPRRKA